MAPTAMPTIAPRLMPVSFGTESIVKLKQNKGLLKQI